MWNSILKFLMKALCGCNRVNVVDENLRPLAGVKVTSRPPIKSGDDYITDQDGSTSIPHLPGQNMICVELSGYEATCIRTIPDFPQSITLKTLRASPSHH